MSLRPDDGKKELRPWGRHVSDHDYGLASIILYQTPEKKEASDPEPKKSELEFRSTPSTGGGRGRSSQRPPAPTGNRNEPSASVSNNSRPTLQAVPESIIGDRQVAMLDLDDAPSTNYYGVFNNFSLLGVSELTDEIMKLHVNFSDYWNLFFFGQKPKVYQFTGLFLDSREYPYYQEFMTAYDKYLNGRKAVENKMEMVISYQGKFVSGYLVSVSVKSSSDNEYIKRFSFRVVVKEEGWARDNYFMSKPGGGSVSYDDAGIVNVLDNRYRFMDILGQDTENVDLGNGEV